MRDSPGGRNPAVSGSTLPRARCERNHLAAEPSGIREAYVRRLQGVGGSGQEGAKLGCGGRRWAAARLPSLLFRLLCCSGGVGRAYAGAELGRPQSHHRPRLLRCGPSVLVFAGAVRWGGDHFLG
jgi:hypothetical protein